MNLFIIFLILIAPSNVRATYQQDTWHGVGNAEIRDIDDLNTPNDKMLESLPMHSKGLYPKKPKTGVRVGECSVDVEIGGGQKPSYYLRCEKEFDQ